MELAALEREIAETPRGDDAPRLRYADAVEPIDAARARFIRIQCRLRAIREDGVIDHEYAALSDEETELLARHGDEWARPFAPYAAGWTFRRGFVEELRLDARTFVDQGDALRRRAPIVHWTLAGAAGLGRAIAGSAPSIDMVSLSLADNGLADRDVEELVGVRPLPRLAWLDLSENYALTEASAWALARSSFVPALRALRMFGVAADPVARAGFDWDGTLVHEEPTPIGLAIARELGDRPWLHPMGPSSVGLTTALRFRL